MIRVRLRKMMRSYSERTGERLTYALLAERAGLSRATVEAVGSRPSYNATLDTVDRLCLALGCDIEELLEFSSEGGFCEN